MINYKLEFKEIHTTKCTTGLHIQCPEYLNLKIPKTNLNNLNTGIAAFHMKSIQKIQSIYQEKDL